MALNIGQITFGIDADTRGIKQSIDFLTKFRQQINQVARSQTKASQSNLVALSKQESAAKRNIQNFLNLSKAMKRAKMPKGEVEALEKKLNRLTKELTSGRLQVHEYARALDGFKKNMGDAGRSLKDFKSGVQKGTKEGQSFESVLRNLESSAVLAIGPLSGVGARIRSFGAIAGRSSKFVIGLFVGITALGVGFFKLAAGALSAGRVMEATFARFKAASGNIAIARKEMGFVIQTALKLGLRIDTSAKAFSRLAASAAGTALAGEGARKVFLAVSKAAAALRLDAGEVEGTFRAIEQMMSKGTVQAEELRGQLGERLPGAFRLAAAAMKVTTAELGKMLKSGEVMAEEFLPLLAEQLEKTFGEVALENVDSFTGSMNNLANQTLLFGDEFNKVTGISTAVIGALHLAADAVEFLRRNLINIISLLVATTAALAALAHKRIWLGILFVADAVKTLAIAMTALNAAAAGAAVKGLMAVFKKFTIVIGVFIATFLALKALLSDNTEALDDMDTALEGLGEGINATKNLGSAFDTLTKSIADAVAETKVSLAVMADLGEFPVKDIELLTLRYKTFNEVAAKSEDELKALFDELKAVGETPAALTIAAVADSLFRVRGDAQAAADKLQNMAAKLKAMGAFGRTMVDLSLRFKAMSEGGLEGLKTFESLDAVILQLTRQYEGLGIPLEVIEALARVYTEQLKLNKQALEELTEAEKLAAEQRKEATKATEDMIKGLGEASKKIEAMKRRNLELAKGPGSFEVFEKVTIKVEEMTASMIEWGINSQAAAVWARDWQTVLEENLRLTGSGAKALKAQSSATAKFARTIEDITLRTAALTEGGLEGLKTFTATDAVVLKLTRQFQDLGFSTDEVKEAVAILTAALLGLKVATDDAREAAKDKSDADKEALAAAKRFEKGIIGIGNTLALIREHNRELAKGPDSFEYFTKVTQKVEAFRVKWSKLIDNQVVLTEMVRQYKAELEASLLMTDRFARASEAMASAVTGVLEDILVTGGSVTDMLHDLANELLRIALRAAFLDKLQASLSLFFGGGAAPSIIPSGAGPNSVTGQTLRGAHGLEFKVPGSGGSDHVPIGILAKPGEIVSVKRPDQLVGSGGGGGVNITQINNFEGGGLADPAVLIPLMQENNRLMKAEFLDSLTRGAFR